MSYAIYNLQFINYCLLFHIVAAAAATATATTISTTTFSLSNQTIFYLNAFQVTTVSLSHTHIAFSSIIRSYKYNINN